MTLSRVGGADIDPLALDVGQVVMLLVALAIGVRGLR